MGSSQYETPLTPLTSKKLQSLRERYKTAREKYEAANGKFHYADAKAKFVTCQKCGSKLSVEELGRKKYRSAYNFCPLCCSDLRPKSTQERLASLDKTQDDLRIAIVKEERALAKKAKRDVRWLVRFGYHV